MTLLPRLALGLLGLSLACQMANPAFNLTRGDESGNADSADTLESSAEGSSNSNSTGDGDGDASTGDGDPTTGDGDPTTGDGDPTTGDGDPTTGDGDPTTGDGDPTTGDGDGDPTTGDGDGDEPICGDGTVDMGEECDDGNDINDDECTNECTWDLPVLDMMSENLECMVNVNPQTCQQCIASDCCFPEPMECLENNTCLCAIACLLNNNNNQLFCEDQCMSDANVVDLAVAHIQCIQANCLSLCDGP